MKTIISLAIMAVMLSACGVNTEQSKLCHFLMTCDEGASDIHDAPAAPVVPVTQQGIPNE